MEWEMRREEEECCFPRIGMSINIYTGPQLWNAYCYVCFDISNQTSHKLMNNFVFVFIIPLSPYSLCMSDMYVYSVVDVVKFNESSIHTKSELEKRFRCRKFERISTKSIQLEPNQTEPYRVYKQTESKFLFLLHPLWRSRKRKKK